MLNKYSKELKEAKERNVFVYSIRSNKTAASLARNDLAVLSALQKKSTLEDVLNHSEVKKQGISRQDVLSSLKRLNSLADLFDGKVLGSKDV